MKVIFFGTPIYAVPVLQALIDSKHKVVAVVSQPDKAVGRSNKIVPTPVKKLALEHNLPVFQYESIRKDDVSELLNIDADIIVTCAYGQIIGENVLFAKKYGVEACLSDGVHPAIGGAQLIANEWLKLFKEKIDK